MKKINYLLILTIGILSSVFFTSCKKEVTETNMIIKNWTLKSKTIGALDVKTECETNASWNFKSDRSYVIKDACDNTEEGTWELADNGKTLTLDGLKAYEVVESKINFLVIQLQVGDLGLTKWTFN